MTPKNTETEHSPTNIVNINIPNLDFNPDIHGMIWIYWKLQMQNYMHQYISKVYKLYEYFSEAITSR